MFQFDSAKPKPNSLDSNLKRSYSNYTKKQLDLSIIKINIVVFYGLLGITGIACTVLLGVNGLGLLYYKHFCCILPPHNKNSKAVD